MDERTNNLPILVRRCLGAVCALAGFGVAGYAMWPVWRIAQNAEGDFIEVALPLTGGLMFSVAGIMFGLAGVSMMTGRWWAAIGRIIVSVVAAVAATMLVRST